MTFLVQSFEESDIKDLKLIFDIMLQAIEKDVAKSRKISSFFVKKPSDSTTINKNAENLTERNDTNKRKIDELERKSNSEHLSKLRKIENKGKTPEKIKENYEIKDHLKKVEKKVKINSPKKSKNTNESAKILFHVDKTECTNDSSSMINTDPLSSNSLLKERIICDEDSGIVSKPASIEEGSNKNFSNDTLERKCLNEVNKENKLDNKTVDCDKKPDTDKITHSLNSFDLENDFFDDIFDDEFVENNLDLSELRRCIVLSSTKNGRFLNLSLKDSISEQTAFVKCCDYW